MKLLVCAILFFASPVLRATEPAFLIGANIADWECKAPLCIFGREIGNNHWQKENMPSFQWKSDFRPKVWEKIFQDLQQRGANAVRIPLMTEGQGIVYRNAIDIAGVDKTWLANTKKILDLAAKYQMRVEIGILTANTGAKRRWYNFYYGKRMILKDTALTSAYLHLVIGPLLKRIGKHPALWAIDVFAEADGALTEHQGDITVAEIRRFIDASVQFIRPRAPHLKLTASTGYWQHVRPKPLWELVHDLGLDFYEVHLYNQDGSIPDCTQWPKLDLPIMLGEFGLHKFGPPAQQRYVTENFIKHAKRCGFFGAMAWVANPGPSEKPDFDRYQNLYNNEGAFKLELNHVFRNQ